MTDIIPYSEFDPQTKQLSLVNAYWCARAALLVYQPKTVILRDLKSTWGMIRSVYIDNKEVDTQGFVACDDRMIILAFQGTQTLEDWQTDANVRKVTGPFGRVHRGFKQALDAVWDDITSALLEMESSRKVLWICGHSLGAALATLAAAYLSDTDNEINGVYTFGSPRVGDQDFADAYDTRLKRRTNRFINNEDIVTRVPPRAMGYEHVGVARFFDYEGKLHDGAGFWRRWMSQSEGVAARSLERYRELKAQYPNSIACHATNLYVTHIRNAWLQEKKKSGKPMSFTEYINS